MHSCSQTSPLEGRRPRRAGHTAPFNVGRQLAASASSKRLCVTSAVQVHQDILTREPQATMSMSRCSSNADSSPTYELNSDANLQP